MNIIEFNPDGQSTALSAGGIPVDEFQESRIFREILPIVFHKMKNKLTPVLGYAQILHSRSSDEFTMERLRKIEKNTAELTEELNLLKDYFQAEPPPRQPGSINRILQDMGPTWQKIASGEKIRVVLDLDPGAPDISLHAGQLEILLLRMAENALTALKMKGGQGKEIRLSTRAEGNGLKLAIRDNGCGMSAEDLVSIWTPFYAKFPEHTGLGLVICEKIILNHEAVCRVTSSCGEFSQFEIHFPLAEKSLKEQTKGHRQ